MRSFWNVVSMDGIRFNLYFKIFSLVKEYRLNWRRLVIIDSRYIYGDRIEVKYINYVEEKNWKFNNFGV